MALKIKPNGKRVVVELIDELIDVEINTGEIVKENVEGLKRVLIHSGKDEGKIGLVRWLYEIQKVPDSDFYILHEDDVLGIIVSED